MAIELIERPERQRNRVTGGDAPMFPDERIILIDGVRFGYCTLRAGMPITLIRRVTDAEMASIREYVEGVIGGRVSKVSQPPPAPDEPVSMDEVGEDDSGLWLPADFGDEEE